MLNMPPLIRHVSGIGFLVLKLGAHRDRGSGNPRGSKDLSDIVALLATRSDLLAETNAAPQDVRNWIRDDVTILLNDQDIESNVIAHISDRDPLVDNVAERVLEVLEALARLS